MIFVQIIITYLIVTTYLGMWLGLWQIKRPDQKDAIGYVLFNIMMAPVAIPVGIVIGLRNMLSGGVIIVFHVQKGRPTPVNANIPVVDNKAAPSAE